ncbi:hypothetical protein OJ996_05765 [Luteolibacter sp. GHJ8]|uniref:Uncharacterized protein n=1 Tax=Luteolibacter rhizosphaerae TaxID=2989719 RepID=A0ABT3FZR6_9BACT|nr:hypothetical protein [Luteolibacter rhizosphaerae]MCW1913068.1 hypothetical protein [Luteolibacter rhizosphaerae]
MNNENNSGEARTYRTQPTIASLQDLLQVIPKENQALVQNVVAEVREIVTKVLAAGGVIFIGDIAKLVKSIKLRPDEAALKEFIELAADAEFSESGVDIKAAIIHRTLGTVSRYYLAYGVEGEDAKKARRDWAVALEKAHKHFADEEDGESEGIVSAAIAA